MADGTGGGWMSREEWDALVRGEGCPLCRHLSAGAAPNAYRLVVADLAVSQLWLAANQSVPGYCVLVHRRHVRHPYDLPRAERAAFFEDMALPGEALERALGAVKMNFELLGNAVPHLHCHLKPRYYGDPAPGKPIHPDEPLLHLTDGEYAERAQRIRDALAQARTGRRAPRAGSHPPPGEPSLLTPRPHTRCPTAATRRHPTRQPAPNNGLVYTAAWTHRLIRSAESHGADSSPPAPPSREL